jgi:23S rRNA pseudouridine1911/1915/1917 synthase
MMVAKNVNTYLSLVNQLSARKVIREYEAIATGYIQVGRTIKTKIRRSPHNRIKMAVSMIGKEAITKFSVLQHYRGYTRIRCKLETGRTHQIRVQMQYIKAPLLGDPVYNNRLKMIKGTGSVLYEYLRNFKRQALHACKLSFSHPVTGINLVFESEPPEDMKILMKMLEEDSIKVEPT